MTTFLDVSELSKSFSTDDAHEMTVQFQQLNPIHTNRTYALYEADKIFFRKSSDKRSVNPFMDPDLEYVESSGALVSGDLAPKVSEYINNVKNEKRAKSLAAYLMFSGVLFDHLDDLKITRECVIDPINQYYSKIKTAPSKAVEEFYDKVPEAKKLGKEIYQLCNEDTSNLKSLFRSRFEKEPDYNERDLIFINALNKLRSELRSIYSPELNTILQLFGLAPETYRRSKAALVIDLKSKLI